MRINKLRNLYHFIQTTVVCACLRTRNYLVISAQINNGIIQPINIVVEASSSGSELKRFGEEYSIEKSKNAKPYFNMLKENVLPVLKHLEGRAVILYKKMC